MEDESLPVALFTRASKKRSTQRLSAYSRDSGPLHPPDCNSDMSEEWQKLLERFQHEKKGTALVDTCMQEYARLQLREFDSADRTGAPLPLLLNVGRG